MTSPAGDSAAVLAAMRSGEWVRTQWIARVAFEHGARPWNPALGSRALRALRALEAGGEVERRDAAEVRSGDLYGAAVRFTLPRSEWRRQDRAGA